jgi:hypothetical protein
VNGKLNHEDTPEGQLAAVAVLLATRMKDNHIKNGNGPSEPDVADLKEVLRPFVHRLLIKARLDESERIIDFKLERRADLIRQLYILEAQIPKELR